jgi:hypothetical protein
MTISPPTLFHSSMFMRCLLFVFIILRCHTGITGVPRVLCVTYSLLTRPLSWGAARSRSATVSR